MASFSLTKIAEISLICLITMHLSEAQCPMFNDIPQCKCDYSKYNNLFIECEGIKSVDQLSNVASKLNGYEVHELHFVGSKLIFSPSNILKGITIEQLYFIDCEIVTAGEGDSAKDFDVSVKDFTLMKTIIIEGGKWKLNLGNLKNMKSLAIWDNKITKLTGAMSSELPKGLRSLSFCYCNIEEIEDAFFVPLRNVEYLDLGGNKVKNLPDKLATLPLLKTFYLGLNEIKEGPKDLLIFFPNLRDLYMSNNKLSTLPKNVWEDILRKLRGFSIRGNPLVCDDNMKWIVDAKKPEIFYGECEEPDELKYKELKDLTSEDFEKKI